MLYFASPEILNFGMRGPVNAVAGPTERLRDSQSAVPPVSVSKGSLKGRILEAMRASGVRVVLR